MVPLTSVWLPTDDDGSEDGNNFDQGENQREVSRDHCVLGNEIFKERFIGKLNEGFRHGVRGSASIGCMQFSKDRIVCDIASRVHGAWEAILHH